MNHAHLPRTCPCKRANSSTWLGPRPLLCQGHVVLLIIRSFAFLLSCFISGAETLAALTLVATHADSIDANVDATIHVQRQINNKSEKTSTFNIAARIFNLQTFQFLRYPSDRNESNVQFYTWSFCQTRAIFSGEEKGRVARKFKNTHISVS